MDSSEKRKASEEIDRHSNKRQKKQWRVPRRNHDTSSERRSIQPGDSGIWATCDKGRERKCIGELRDLLSEYVDILYGDSLPESNPEEATSAADIEDDIQAEMVEVRQAKHAELFMPIRIDVQCVVFFKTEAPIEPVRLVKRICEDAMKDQTRKRTRCVKRLSPMTLMGRASEDGLDNIARTVLAPYFHQVPFKARKFAIRPSLRNHDVLSRNIIIEQVAKVVGKGHVVDLKNYELLIVVEVYKNVCGISVLDNNFEPMKRYNLAEIFNPTPKEAVD